MAHLQEVGPVVPQDADDSGIGQRPTSAARRTTSTSATASPARNRIPVWDGPGNRVNGGYDATARPRSGRRAARCKGPRAAHMRTLRSVRSSATTERIVADEGVVAVTWPPGPRGYLPPGRSRPVLGHREEFAGLR